jgi:hypothetical protein
MRSLAAVGPWDVGPSLPEAATAVDLSKCFSSTITGTVTDELAGSVSSDPIRE